MRLLSTPLRIRSLELKNRVVMPGMNTKMVRDKHFVDENLIAYHVARAKAGCAPRLQPCGPWQHAMQSINVKN